jgi:hypothetical protein
MICEVDDLRDGLQVPVEENHPTGLVLPDEFLQLLRHGGAEKSHHKELSDLLAQRHMDRFVGWMLNGRFDQ